MTSKHGTHKRSEYSSFVGKPILNPFVRDKHIWNKENETADKLKTAVLTVLLVPLRVLVIFTLLLIAWALACIGTYGYTLEDLKLRPFKGWRSKLRTFVGFLFRSMYFVGSAHYVKIKGTQASPKVAPILIGAPHSTFFDALSVLKSGPASVVGKAEAGQIPFFGKLIDLAQPIYVCREDKDSRSKTIKDIVDRVNSPHDWPQIMIFPEGTCTNKTCLIQFKPGAFLPGLPVQPLLIRYVNETDTLVWTWRGPHVLVLAWRTFAQFHTHVEIEYLPVYYPNSEEIKDPKLFARNVQELMSKALGLPTSDYTFDDVRMLEYASKFKLQFDYQIATMKRLRERIGLAASQIEEFIVKESYMKDDEYPVDFETFVHNLKIPQNQDSADLFRLFIESEENSQNTINFKQYLLHALFLCKLTEAKIELIKFLFMLNGDASHRLRREVFVRTIKQFSKFSTKQLSNLYDSIDGAKRGSISFNDFVQATQPDLKFKALYEPSRLFSKRTKSESQ